MEFKELQTKPVGELHKTLVELRSKADELKAKARMGEIKTVHELSAVQKDIARVMTLLHNQ